MGNYVVKGEIRVEFILFYVLEIKSIIELGNLFLVVRVFGCFVVLGYDMVVFLVVVLYVEGFVLDVGF